MAENTFSVKDEIIQILRETKRNGIETLISSLEKSDFFTKTHENHHYRGGFAENALDEYKIAIDYSKGWIDQNSIAMVCFFREFQPNNLRNYLTQEEKKVIYGKDETYSSSLSVIRALARNIAYDQIHGYADKCYDTYIYLNCDDIQYSTVYKDIKSQIGIITKIKPDHIYIATHVTLAFSSKTPLDRYLYLRYKLAELGNKPELNKCVQITFNKLEVKEITNYKTIIYLVAEETTQEFEKIQEYIREAYQWIGQSPSVPGHAKIPMFILNRKNYSEEQINKIKEFVERNNTFRPITVSASYVTLDRRSDKYRYVTKWKLGSEEKDPILQQSPKIEEELSKLRFEGKTMEGIEDWVMLQLYEATKNKNVIGIDNFKYDIRSKSKDTIFEKCDWEYVYNVLDTILSSDNNDRPFYKNNNKIHIYAHTDLTEDVVRNRYEDHPFHSRIITLAKIEANQNSNHRFNLRDCLEQFNSYFQVPLTEQTIRKILEESDNFNIEENGNGIWVTSLSNDNDQSCDFSNKEVWNTIKEGLSNDISLRNDELNRSNELKDFIEGNKEETLDLFRNYIINTENQELRKLQHPICQKYRVNDINLKNEYLGSLLIRVERLFKVLYGGIQPNATFNEIAKSHVDNEISYAFDPDCQPNSKIHQALINVRDRRNDYAHGKGLKEDFFEKNWRDCLRVYMHFIRKIQKKTAKPQMA